MQKQVLQKGNFNLNQTGINKQYLQTINKGKRNKGKPESKRKFGYWRNSEQLKYLSFLRTNYLIMKNAQLRAQFQIFKKMSTFIRSRDAIQCKSHHQKMLMKNNGKLQCIINQQIAPKDSKPEYIYHERRNDYMMREHLSKIETNEELPYFMIKEPQRLLIVIDQRFMISY